ncbi:MAG: hypothetical protein ACLUFN_08765 [Eubacterium sp.]
MGLFSKKNKDGNLTIRMVYIAGLPSNYTPKMLFYLVLNEDAGILQFKKSLKTDECVNLAISKITKYEIITEEKIKENSGIGRAIAGGLLFGTAGAVVGAVTAKDKKKKEYFDCITYISDNEEKAIVMKNSADFQYLKFFDRLCELIPKQEIQTTVDL